MLNNRSIMIIFFKMMLLLFISSTVVFAEENVTDTIPEGPWKFNLFASQQLNQISFSNWAQGGENSLASTSVLNFGATYTKGNFELENMLNMSYGILKVEDTPVRKNEDRIFFWSKGGREVSNNLSTSILLEFRTQFAKGYKYPNDSVMVSNFMAPGKLRLSLGADYKPWEFLSIFFSPASGRLIFVLDETLSNQGAFGVKEGESIAVEFGVLANFMFSKEVFEDVIVESRLTLFNNLVDNEKDNRKNTNVDWETSINLKINHYLSASFLFHLLYDHDIIQKTQTRQLLGIGFSYRI